MKMADLLFQVRPFSLSADFGEIISANEAFSLALPALAPDKVVLY